MKKAKPAVLLVNLGSPASPTTTSVALFLRRFLWDRRVVKINRILWWFILHFLVLPIRSRRVTKLYQKIWTPEGSPLIVNTQRLAASLEKELSMQLGFSVPVFTAMTYSNPSLKENILNIIKNKVSNLVILPLFPQYSSTTTAAVFDSIAPIFENKIVPSLYFVSHYCHEEEYLRALASTIEEYWRINGRQERLLFSFHGIPLAEIEAGDPYKDHCILTAEGVARLLNIPENYWKISFQSRFGFAAWTGPSIEEQLKNWIQEGVKSVSVIAPSFAVDCLETLEELNIRTRSFFLKEGGVEFHYIPALNDRPSHLNALVSLIKKYF